MSVQSRLLVAHSWLVVLLGTPGSFFRLLAWSALFGQFLLVIFRLVGRFEALDRDFGAAPLLERLFHDICL